MAWIQARSQVQKLQFVSSKAEVLKVLDMNWLAEQAQTLWKDI